MKPIFGVRFDDMLIAYCPCCRLAHFFPLGGPVSACERARAESMAQHATAQNAAIEKLLGGRIREQGWINLLDEASSPLFDHEAYVWKERRPLAIISHSYSPATARRYAFYSGRVARRLRLESAWHPGCRVYVIAQEDAPEWAGLAEVLG